MKKLVSLLLALAMVLSLCSFAAAEDYSDVTIRIYSNSNSTERANWLKQAAKKPVSPSPWMTMLSSMATWPLCRLPTRTRTATSSSA